MYVKERQRPTESMRERDRDRQESMCEKGTERQREIKKDREK